MIKAKQGTYLMNITGTFLGEIQASYEIPSQNWGAEDWDKDFAAMKSIGIDTVIMIRCGVGKKIAYPSQVLMTEVEAYEPYTDMLELYLRLSEKYEMKFFVGTYFSTSDWLSAAYDLQKEADLMKRVCDEIWEKYGSKSPAFAGWYFSQEISTDISFNVVECFKRLGTHCHEISGLPTIISPGIEGANTGKKRLLPEREARRLAISPEEHRESWDWILKECQGAIDIVAFQNAHIKQDRLPEFLAINKELIDKYGMEAWTNAECFELEVATRFFPPIEIDRLLKKLEFADSMGYKKAITYEFSHFMSPNSCYLQARNLYKRYCEHFEIEI
jgi:Domain of unknown function (DUF4434)